MRVMSEVPMVLETHALAEVWEVPRMSGRHCQQANILVVGTSCSSSSVYWLSKKVMN